jgi:hypothetical protein
MLHRVSWVRRLAAALLLPLLTVPSTGCLITVGGVVTRDALGTRDAESVGTPVSHHTPLKAHLHDGSTIIFLTGATVTSDRIVASGEAGFVYAPGDTVPNSRAQSIARDQVAAATVYERDLDEAQSALPTALVTGTVTVLVLILYVGYWLSEHPIGGN